MQTFLVKQKFRLGGERLDIRDDRGELAYQLEGSFLRFLKPFPSMTLLVIKPVRLVKSSCPCFLLLSFN